MRDLSRLRVRAATVRFGCESAVVDAYVHADMGGSRTLPAAVFGVAILCASVTGTPTDRCIAKGA